MLSLTDIKNSLFGGAQATTSGTTRRARRRGRTAAAAAPARNGNGSGAAIQADQLALTTQAQETNPYEGTAPSHTRVTVGKWGSGQNDSLAGILHQQGYSSQEVYKKDASGRTLLDEVSRVNGLRNPNLIREGQELVIPSRAQENNAEPAPAPQPNPEPAPNPQPNPTPAPNNNERPEPAVNQVRVDGWRQGDNDSLGAILKNQGFSDSEIYRQDANGDSLLKKVARANGLSSPDRIRAGQSLDVPNSMEALDQMNIPEMERPAPSPQPNPEPAPNPQPNPQPNPDPAPNPQPNPEPAPTPTPDPNPNPAPNNNDNRGEATANMGMLLDGVKDGKFKRDEFQYLNALSNRYEETRAEFSADGFNDDELRTLGAFERRYGTDFARLYNRDDIRLSNQTNTTSTDPSTQVRVRHYNEGGQIWDNYSNGSLGSEAAITAMMRQRAEARELGGQ